MHKMVSKVRKIINNVMWTFPPCDFATMPGDKIYLPPQVMRVNMCFLRSTLEMLPQLYTRGMIPESPMMHQYMTETQQDELVKGDGDVTDSFWRGS